MPEAEISTSQESSQVIDTGDQSFSVDSTPKPEAAPEKEEIIKAATDDPGEQTTGDESPADQADAEPEKKVDTLPKGVQKRLDTITRKRRDAEREADNLRNENAALKEAVAEKEAFAEKAKEPNEEDFDTDEEYEEALVNHKVNAAIKKRDSEQTVKDREEIQRERTTNLQAKLDKVAGKYDDFDEVIRNVKVTSAMEDAIGEIPNTGDVAYYLGQNLDMVDEIADLSPVQSVFRIKEISDKLLTKKTTKAPNPLRTITSTGGDIKSLENMSMAEYNKVRDKQDRERAGRY